MRAVPTYFHLVLLAARVISRGKGQIECTLAQPKTAWISLVKEAGPAVEFSSITAVQCAPGDTSLTANIHSDKVVARKLNSAIGLRDFSVFAFFWKDLLQRQASIFRMLTRCLFFIIRACFFFKSLL